MNKRLVMGFGTFDAVHPGHLFYLNQLKALGDELFVIIARDSNVERIKGCHPHFKENVRKEHVEKMNVADKVILGNKSDFFKVLRDYRPDILGFGYDQRVNMEDIKKHFPQIKVVRIASFEPHKYKSSFIKSKFTD